MFRSDSHCRNFPLPISRVRHHRFWFSPLPLREAPQHLFCGHGLLTHPGRGRLHSATVIVDQVVVVVGVGRRYFCLADGPAPPPGSALVILSGTVAGCDGLRLLPPIARVEYGSPWRRWPRQSCHPRITAGPVPIRLPHTAGRFVQTAARTASIPKTARAGSWRTWSGVEPPGRS